MFFPLQKGLNLLFPFPLSERRVALQLCNPSDCQITYLDEYYLTNYEIELLKKSAAEMASKIPEGAIVVELGSGLVSTFFSPTLS